MFHHNGTHHGKHIRRSEVLRNVFKVHWTLVHMLLFNFSFLSIEHLTKGWIIGERRFWKNYVQLQVTSSLRNKWGNKRKYPKNSKTKGIDHFQEISKKRQYSHLPPGTFKKRKWSEQHFDLPKRAVFGFVSVWLRGSTIRSISVTFH